jgi:glutamate--cysteine ligase
MEAFFDGDGPEGRVMMTRTASVQVNLDLGDDEAAVARRWRLVHDLGPTLAAAFANSPLAAGRPTGWCSTRLGNWFAMDRSRTAPADEAGPGPAAWVDYALDARVMLVRHGERYQPQRDGLTFTGWLARGHELGWPTLDDLDYHLTTLFPPVRPRGWLELRFLDALPEPWWRVAAVAATVGLDDELDAERAQRASRGCGRLWCEAARHGLGHPALHASARAFFAGLTAACGRARADTVTTDACAEFYDRYVAPGRCPALDWGTTA